MYDQLSTCMISRTNLKNTNLLFPTWLNMTIYNEDKTVK